MNQGRIWCVVNPTVGLPLFLGSVAVTALIVHAEVLSHTTWYSAYWQGKAGVKAAQVVAPASESTAPGKAPALAMATAETPQSPSSSP
jgi:light-harvesting protein B-800-850 alpha chain